MKRTTNKSIKTIRTTKRPPLAASNGHCQTNGHDAPVAEPAKNNLLSFEDIQALQNEWRVNPRWQGVSRSYTPERVLRLRGTIKIEHTLAEKMSRKLWSLLQTEPYVHA